MFDNKNFLSFLLKSADIKIKIESEYFYDINYFANVNLDAFACSNFESILSKYSRFSDIKCFDSFLENLMYVQFTIILTRLSAVYARA